MITNASIPVTRCLAVLSAAFALAAPAQAETSAIPGNFLGTWSMNAAKSKALGDTLPKSYTAKFTDVGAGKVHAHVEWTSGTGVKAARDYTVTANGKPVPVTGDKSVDAVSITSQKNGTVQVNYLKGGKLLEWAHYTEATDGKTIRGTESSKDAKGVTVTYMVVLDRQ